MLVAEKRFINISLEKDEAEDLRTILSKNTLDHTDFCIDFRNKLSRILGYHEEI